MGDGDECKEGLEVGVVFIDFFFPEFYFYFVAIYVIYVVDVQPIEEEEYVEYEDE